MARAGRTVRAQITPGAPRVPTLAALSIMRRARAQVAPSDVPRLEMLVSTARLPSMPAHEVGLYVRMLVERYLGTTAGQLAELQAATAKSRVSRLEPCRDALNASQRPTRGRMGRRNSLSTESMFACGGRNSIQALQVPDHMLNLAF